MGKAAEDGSAGTTTARGREFGAPDEGDPPPFAFVGDAHLGAEMREHLFGVVARGLGLDDGRAGRAR